MIDLSTVVWVVVYLLVAGAVFGLLFFLINYIAKQFPGPAMDLFAKVARILLIVLAVLVLIGLLVSFISGQPLIRWGPAGSGPVGSGR